MTPPAATIALARAVDEVISTMSDTDTAKLSRREHEALAYLVRGLSNREIAASLGISTNTVNKHVQQIFTKLGVRNRVEVVIRAFKLETMPLAGDYAQP
jgi:DNA-binding NarL/FixJ family response regulator